MTGAGAASRNNNGAAEVEFYAQSEHFPELNMDKDTVREVKSAWLMFVALQGGPEAAEDAICKKLQSVDSPFAQLLYPDKVNKRSSKGKDFDEWSAEGQRKKADDWSPEGRAAKYRRDQAAILRAGQDPRTNAGGRHGSGGGGGCPMARLGGGLGGAMGAFGDDLDHEEMREVMKIVQRANAAAAAAAKAQAAAGGEPAARDAVGRVKSLGAGVKADAKKLATNSGASAPHSASSKRAASAQRGASSKRAADATGAGVGGDTGLASGGGAAAGHVVHGVDLSVYKQRVSVGRGPSPGAEARRRAATPSGRSTAHLRRVSL